MKSTSRKSWQQTAQEAREKLGPSVESGYFCLVREAVQHLWPKPGQRWTPFEAHALLCELAAVAKHTRRLQSGRAFAAYEVERGQLLVTRKWLADTWQWDRGTVDRFLQQLVDQGNITIQRLSQIVTRIEITSYEQHRQRKEAADADALLDELHQLNEHAVTPNQTKPSHSGQSKRVSRSTQTDEVDQFDQSDQTEETSGTRRKKSVAPMPQPNGEKCHNRKSAFYPEKPEVSGADQGQDATTELAEMPQPLNKKKVLKKKENNTHTREADFSFSEEERQEEAAEVSSGAGSSGPSGSTSPSEPNSGTDPSGHRSNDRAGHNGAAAADRNGTSAADHGSNSPAGSVLSCQQLVDRFNALPGTTKVGCNSVVQKAYAAQCREHSDLPQLLEAALDPRFWPLAKLGRDVTLPWLLKNPETIIEIPSGELSKPRPQRNGRAAAAGAVTTPAAPLEVKLIDPERFLVMPHWVKGLYWDEELQYSDLRVYDQRQLQLIRQLNDCLLVHDERHDRTSVPSLVLSGPSGIGKDMLLNFISGSNAILDHGIPDGLPCELEAVSLQGRDDWEAMSQLYGDATDVGLLILSDPERLAGNRWHRTKLSQLLRERSEAGRPTWITTNCPTLAELATAIEPSPAPGERSPAERRLVTDAEQHFLRAEWPAYDQVRAQLESGELPSLPYCEAVVPAEEYRQQLEDLPARKWAAFEQRAELLPQTWLPLWSRLHPGEEPVATPRPNPLQELLHEMDEAEDAGDDGPSRRDTSGAVLGVSSIGWQPRSTPADDAGKTADVDDADDYGPDDDEDPKRKSKSKRKPKPKPKAKPAAKAQPPKRKPKQKTKANPGRSLRKPPRRQPPVD